jgi:3-dehydroquinate dehydratase-2
MGRACSSCTGRISTFSAPANPSITVRPLSPRSIWLLAKRAASAGVNLESFQSNHEGALIERVHAAGQQGVRYMIVNPAAYTHTSVALRDAIAGTGIPFIEVHLSNVHAREAFRHHSYFSDLAIGVITGLGSEGYLLALEYLLSKVSAE